MSLLPSTTSPPVPINCRVPVWPNGPGGAGATRLLESKSDGLHKTRCLATMARLLKLFPDRVPDSLQKMASPNYYTLNVHSADTAIKILNTKYILNGYERYLIDHWDDPYVQTLTPDQKIVVLAGGFKEKLDDWGQARFCVEQTLQYGPDVRYLALGWGGSGPIAYGPISFRFRKPAAAITYFNGDSGAFVRKNSIKRGSGRLLSRGCTEGALSAMILADHFIKLCRHNHVPSQQELDAYLTNNPRIIEAHVHGAVGMGDLVDVRFSDSYIEDRRDDLREAVDAGITNLAACSGNNYADQYDELYRYLLLQRRIRYLRRWGA